jgi:hypothetical protein
VELIRRTRGCTSPIRLVGESIVASASSGEVLARRSTDAEAPGFVLTACGNRRASRCLPYSEIYRRDAYFLVAAGLTGSEAKGVPTSVASHPVVFATLTAPSFGAVHRRVVRGDLVLRCRTTGTSAQCGHGVSTQCLERHAEGDIRIGQALCPDCYDYEAAAVWNAAFGSLWRRTVTYLPRELAALARLSVRALRSQVRVTYAKVAEFQARGVVHVHTVVRTVGRAAARVSVTVEGSSGRELVVRWGQQIDVRPISPDLEDGRLSPAERTIAASIRDGQVAMSNGTAAWRNARPYDVGRVRRIDLIEVGEIVR